jgi:DNA ligase 1
MQPSSYRNRNGQIITDPTGWWMSEKLDGMKGVIRNGELFTRSGKKLDAPSSFLSSLPKNFDFEGELYFGRNTFNKTASLRKTSKEVWDKVQFHIFDFLEHDLTWIERQAVLVELFEENKEEKEKKIQLVKWEKVDSTNHVEEKMKEIRAKNGEGLILANPNAKYEEGVSENILKYKSKYDDEAKIIGYRVDDDGQRLVSFEVKNGTKVFNIGTGLKKKLRYNFKKSHPIGTMITYEYEIMGKNGKPRTPVYKGIRIDL